MLCSQCGNVSLDDSNFCSTCGNALEATVSEAIPVDGVQCVYCDCFNEEHVSFCRSCGQTVAKIAVVGVPAESSVGTDAPGSYISHDSDIPSLLGSDVQVSTRHESFIAKLDEMEKELETRQSVPLVEPSVIELDEESQGKLDSLSSTLDGLIADLLEVEINEYAFPDFIHPDESGFPSVDPASYEKNEDAPPPVKKRSLHELLLIGALIIAIFLVGLSFGLWGSYFLGL
ncbi:MAG: hypothetical protein LBT31_04005 [Synergistaceae bacterium]|jgi:hypothetical protein|nr:hypothetical protein [Synergistaceae bacterium]